MLQGIKFRLFSMMGRKRGIALGIHKDAHVDASVSVGSGSRIGIHAEITGDVAIGDNCIIDAGARIAGPVRIGNNTRIGSNVAINESMRGMVQIGPGSVIQRNAEISGNVSIGSHSTVGSNTVIKTTPEGKCVIGDDVLINHFSLIGACRLVEIKSHCIFAAFLHITDSTHTFQGVPVPVKHAPVESAPVLIEEEVWLGSNVMVMMGCVVGKGSVIGAKSLVNKSVPPNTIAFGIPAKVYKSR